MFGNRHQKSQQFRKGDKDQNAAEAKCAIETTKEVAEQKVTESHSDARNVAEAKKTEIYTATAQETSKKSVATQNTRSEMQSDSNTQQYKKVSNI